ncbi:MAG: DUF1573 domain-containing protein [Bacteroidales bacterium]|jgi:hypothetical protein|nr:DUF1573 domain-containing protein [Bacteroidales bacterium]
MKRIFLTSLLALSVVFGANAQSSTTPATQPVHNTGAQAEIKFEKTEHDYGTVKKGGDGTCQFTYTNVGKAPLIISDARSSCGCTVPVVSKEPLMPGQSASITVKYNTNNVGAINKSVTVTSNAVNDKVVLHIKGKVEQ